MGELMINLKIDDEDLSKNKKLMVACSVPIIKGVVPFNSPKYRDLFVHIN